MKNILLLIALSAAAQLSAQTFTATVNQPIPDDGSTVSFDLEVTGLPAVADTTFGLTEVCLNIDHTWDADLEVRIMSPDSTVFLLFSGIGGDGDNWENCCLREDAATPIFSEAAPFTGVFKPMGSLGNVNNGQNPNGTWRIILHDTYAFADAGFIKDWSLTFDANAPGPFTFDGTYLPIVKILAGGQTIPNEPKIPAELQIIRHGNGQLNFPTDTAFEFEGKILVELQGYTGPSYPKKNYDFDLTDEQGFEMDTSLLGMPAENDWILKAEYLDPTLMGNAVAYEFSRRMGQYAPRTMFCEVFLDGEYQGLYTLTEKVKRDKNRVNIAKLTPQDIAGDSLTGGYIIEMNHNGAPGAWDSDYLPINYNTCDLPVQYKHVYPKSTEILPVQADYIRAYVDSFEYSLHQPGYADPVNGYRRWMDDSTFLDFMLVNEMSTNYDSYGRSTFLYKEKITAGGKLKIGPPWDYDRGYCCVEGWVWEITHPYWPFPDWWSILHSDSLFLQQRYCRWSELRETTWTTPAFMQYMDSLHILLAEPAARNFQRWPELGYADFDGNLAARKQLIADRLAWMDEQITWADCQVVTGTEENSLPSWSLHPNPAGETVLFDPGNLTGTFRLQIRDVNGRLMFSTGDFAPGKLPVDVSQWAPGIYFAKVTGTGGRWVKKLVVW